MRSRLFCDNDLFFSRTVTKSVHRCSEVRDCDFLNLIKIENRAENSFKGFISPFFRRFYFLGRPVKKICRLVML